jgi:hypothetical protein
MVVLARVGLLACALVTALFAFSPPRMGMHLFPWDKADHFLSFFVIMTVTLVSFPRTRVLWLAFAVSLLGALIEVVQGLPMVGRDADPFDWMAENAAIAAVVFVFLASRIRLGLSAARSRWR